jgi:hypothetical protein
MEGSGGPDDHDNDDARGEVDCETVDVVDAPTL